MSDIKASLIPDDAIKEIGSKLYDDTAKPGFSEIGRAIGNVMKFVALPFSFLGMTADELEKKYRVFITNALNKVDDANRIITANERIGLLLDHAKFAFNHEDLYIMFEDLLASFCDKKTENLVHPYFIHLLNQIGPYDAHILRKLASNRAIPCINISIMSKKGNITITKVDDYFFSVTNTEEMKKADASLNILREFGIVAKETSGENVGISVDGDIYENLLKSSYIVELLNESEKEIAKYNDITNNEAQFYIKIVKKSIDFTDLGKKFVKCCVRNSVIDTPFSKEEREIADKKIHELFKNKDK